VRGKFGMNKKNTIRISSGRALGDVIDAIIKETLDSAIASRTLREKDIQKNMSSSSEDSDDSKGDNGSSDEQSATMKASTDKNEKPKYDDIVERLNAIRAGRSLKDEGVAGAFKEYFESLNDAERLALFAFLKGIAQIVSGQVPAHDAVDPGDSPANVQMQRAASKKSKHIKPNVIKKPLPVPGAKQTTKSTEDTTPPTPITPKKK